MCVEYVFLNIPSGRVSVFLEDRASSLFQPDTDFEIELTADGHEVHHPKGLCTWPQTARTLFAEIVGIGVLAIPKVFSHLGYIGASLVIVLVGLINAWSMFVITDIVVENPQVRTLAQLGDLIGPKTKALIGGSVNAYLFGICVVVYVSCAESLQNFLYACGLNLCKPLCGVFVLVVMLPVAQIRSLHGLNYLIIVSIVCIFVPVLITLADLGSMGKQYTCAADGPGNSGHSDKGRQDM
jgi:amino acid permease